MGNAIKRSTIWPRTLACVVLGASLATTVNSMEGQGSLAPAKVKEIQKTNQSYRECTKAATAAVNAGKMKAQDLPAAFSRCTDKYPAAGLFNDCKKRALRSAKEKQLKTPDLSECQKLQSAVSFEPSAAVPLYVSAGQSFFAGIGLNRDLKLSEMDQPNFTCERLQDAVTDIPKKAQHILFGNNPKMFLDGADQVKWLKWLSVKDKKKAKDSKFIDIEGLGRLFGDPRSPQSMIYFPSSSCDYKRVLGQNFTGLSVFYLPDIAAQTATPYFGIAYYRPAQKSITTPELVAEVLSRLGREFKAYSRDASTIFISSTPFQEVDQERDPRNICKKPRPHQYVAVIRTVATDPNAPEYLLLANIRNLCDYGERQAKRLAK